MKTWEYRLTKSILGVLVDRGHDPTTCKYIQTKLGRPLQIYKREWAKAITTYCEAPPTAFRSVIATADAHDIFITEPPTRGRNATGFFYNINTLKFCLFIIKQFGDGKTIKSGDDALTEILKHLKKKTPNTQLKEELGRLK